VRDELDGKLDIAQRRTKSHGYQLEQHFQGTHMQTRDLRPQGYIFPETSIVGNLPPSTTNPGQATDLPVRQVREDVQQHLVGQLFDGLWARQIV